jgi:hypothetical protein
MKLCEVAIVVGALTLSSPSIAAEPAMTFDVSKAAEALGACFVAKTTGHDRVAVARWMIGAMASAPQLADITKVDKTAQDEADKQMAQIFTRLLAKDCVEFAKPLIQAKSSSAAFETAGEALGKVAVQELISNKSAAAALEGFTKYLDEADFKEMRAK